MTCCFPLWKERQRKTEDHFAIGGSSGAEICDNNVIDLDSKSDLRENGDDGYGNHSLQSTEDSSSKRPKSPSSSASFVHGDGATKEGLLEFPRSRPPTASSSSRSSPPSVWQRASTWLSKVSHSLVQPAPRRTVSSSSAKKKGGKLSGSNPPQVPNLRPLVDVEIETILATHGICMPIPEDMEVHPKQVHLHALPSNRPIEDVPLISAVGSMLLLGVFDGHGGPECARLAVEYLPTYFTQALRDIPEAEAESRVPTALRLAFERFDREIILELPRLLFPGIDEGVFTPSRSAPQVKRALRPALAGCVGSLAVVDGNMIHVAHVGDSRVLLVRSLPGEGIYFYFMIVITCWCHSKGFISLNLRIL
jgi:hypothetical protein